MLTSVINDLLKEEKLINLWPEYPCLFNISSADFKNQDKRDMAYCILKWQKKWKQTVCIAPENEIVLFEVEQKFKYVLRKFSQTYFVFVFYEEEKP